VVNFLSIISGYTARLPNFRHLVGIWLQITDLTFSDRPWQPNLGSKSAKSAYSPSFVALAFQNTKTDWNIAVPFSNIVQ